MQILSDCNTKEMVITLLHANNCG